VSLLAEAAPPAEHALSRRLAAEAIGSFFLFAGVLGSGVMAQNLMDGNVAVALLANTIATGAILYVLIAMLGPISGAHFNPAVSLAFFLRGELPVRDLLGYIVAQVVGGLIGVWATHAMFDLPIWQWSLTMHRTGGAQWFSEGIATFGLLLVIFGGLRARADAVPTLVALYITGAYWFTASTSFANPAVTLARGFSDTFAGINPAHVPAFIAAQLVAVGISHFTLKPLLDE